MALPNTINPLSPLGSDSPSLGDDQLRALKQYLVDVAGYPNNSAVSAAAFSVSTAGVVTVSQSPLTVPTLLQGTASQVLRIGSQYSNIGFEINAATVMALSTTGMVMQTRYAEWVSGVTGVLGTQGAQPLILRTNTLDQWQVTPSGMLTPVASVVDLGTLAGPNPRNLYVASNIIVGGQIQAGAAPRIITTPTGMLDIAQLAVSGEVRGDVLFRGVSAWQRLAAGSVGQLLASQGSAADPIWQTGSPGVAIGDNPAWTGQHTWSLGTNMYMSSPSVRFGLGTSTPTYLLDIRGNMVGTSNLYLGNQFVAGATGMLGVGTLTPTAMLHIAGSAYVASNIYLAGSNLPLPVGLGTSRLTFVSGTSIQLGQGVIPLRVNGSWTQRAIASAITVANTGLAANTTYFVYAADSAGSTILDAPSTTGHSTDSTFGVETKTGDTTRTLVGMLRTGAGVPGVFQAAPLTLTFFNRRSLSQRTNFTVDRTTASASYVELNTEIENNFLTWADEDVFASVNGSVGRDVNAGTSNSAVAFDGTVAESGLETEATGTSTTQAIALAGWKSGLVEGFHFATLLGASSGTGTSTWHSSTALGTKARVVLHVGVRG